MKPSSPHWIIASLILCAVCACQNKYQNQTIESSQTASIAIGEFKPGEGNPSWSSAELQMQSTDDPSKSYEKTIPLALFHQQSFTDLSVEVKYGLYRINILYRDSSSQLLYQVCSDNRSLVRTINQPKVNFTLPICLEGSDKSVGTVVITPPPGSDQTPPSGDKTGGNQTSPSSPQQGDGSNPFALAQMYVDPFYVANVQKTAAKTRETDPALSDKMLKMQQFSTALWLDSIEKIAKLDAFLQGAADAQQKSGQATVATIVVYDLPGRDCKAASSNGELLANSNDFERYKSEYIDVIAKKVAQYSSIKIAAIIEPDSLPNSVTNLRQGKCTEEVVNYYKNGVAYAINKLAQPHMSLYLDSAHSGWLGWENNRREMARVVVEVLNLAGGLDKIRGFATNVSNYTPLSIPAGQNPGWYDSSNPAKGELSFIQLMAADFMAAGIKDPHFVIDTSRNGIIDSRSIWGSWCNVKGAGVGERPKANPAAMVDAYLWIKTPGESDGVSTLGAPRLDDNCRNEDSSYRLFEAPQAGVWFDDQFSQLVSLASPAL